MDEWFDRVDVVDVVDMDRTTGVKHGEGASESVISTSSAPSSAPSSSTSVAGLAAQSPFSSPRWAGRNSVGVSALES